MWTFFWISQSIFLMESTKVNVNQGTVFIFLLFCFLFFVFFVFFISPISVVVVLMVLLFWWWWSGLSLIFHVFFFIFLFFLSFLFLKICVYGTSYCKTQRLYRQLHIYNISERAGSLTWKELRQTGLIAYQRNFKSAGVVGSENEICLGISTVF